jgi:hypothetical protein
MIDKLFKIGVLILGLAFIALYCLYPAGRYQGFNFSSEQGAVVDTRTGMIWVCTYGATGQYSKDERYFKCLKWEKFDPIRLEKEIPAE